MTFSETGKHKTKTATHILLLLLVSLTTVRTSGQQPAFPKITGYAGILHPLVTFSREEKPHYNFDGAYVIGIPTGINIWKSAKIGFSMEFVPLIRAANGTSKMNNFLFHPGALFGLGNGFTLATRAAFETSGRYGLTPVLNKIVKKNKGSSYFIAVPIPIRFGNDLPSSVSIGFQFGISF
ncbi:hypothetical protein [Pseudobacter ginsenosidimutans]|uniref:Outer membrane protein with beta-barrel domain n=1 Tax=Pseudobacter ginsenosidimutans TaxID=661488 RepID=A0A4Q7MT03_9BACT|nr:hypothetical protein [Pseudobacter ginsenosidimutans]QEC42096.1 hypothetical protein FSB84_10505 [Pseudobacter ginsenosidimutans]RZS71064.1 hypothetical protein EV199_2965 [Pseudobacter ginsenosidimutans]